MPRISEDLIRKRAEHNECVISTLQEISLHQQDIEKIEHIDKWCRDLEILYLQSNLIPRIENVGRLKKLNYLNLALNNIEKIENLEGCESLRKLDLTVNFIGELTGVERLKVNYNLRDLYLTGNPCVDFEGYRQYVIATLLQLQYLDGIIIEKSERIQATQVLPEIRDAILEQEARYHIKRQKEKQDAETKLVGTGPKKDGTDWYTDTASTPKINEIDDDVEAGNKTEEEREREFWEEKTTFTPESRLEVHKHMEEKRKREQKKSDEPEKKERKLISGDGRRYNVNEAKIDFSLKDDVERGVLELDVAVFRYLDTSLCDVDVQPHHILVTIKGKVLQLVLSEEVQPDSSTAKRSQTTGHLVITMPKAKQIIKGSSKKREMKTARQEGKENKQSSRGVRHETLEVDPKSKKTVQLDKIVKNPEDNVQQPLECQPRRQVEERANSTDFVDDPDVPPLM